MNDTCKHCTARGDIKTCSTTPCNTHDSWYAQQQDKEIKKLTEVLINLTHDCLASDFNEHWDSYKTAVAEIKL